MPQESIAFAEPLKYAVWRFITTQCQSMTGHDLEDDKKLGLAEIIKLIDTYPLILVELKSRLQSHVDAGKCSPEGMEEFVGLAEEQLQDVQATHLDGLVQDFLEANPIPENTTLAALTTHREQVNDKFATSLRAVTPPLAPEVMQHLMRSLDDMCNAQAHIHIMEHLLDHYCESYFPQYFDLVTNPKTLSTRIEELITIESEIGDVQRRFQDVLEPEISQGAPEMQAILLYAFDTRFVLHRVESVDAYVNGLIESSPQPKPDETSNVSSLVARVLQSVRDKDERLHRFREATASDSSHTVSHDVKAMITEKIDWIFMIEASVILDHPTLQPPGDAEKWATMSDEAFHTFLEDFFDETRFQVERALNALSTKLKPAEREDITAMVKLFEQESKRNAHDQRQDALDRPSHAKKTEVFVECSAMKSAGKRPIVTDAMAGVDPQSAVSLHRVAAQHQQQSASNDARFAHQSGSQHTAKNDAVAATKVASMQRRR